MSAAMAALLSAHGSPEAELVQPCDGVISEQRIGTPDQGQVMAEILRCLGQVHWCQLVSGRDALVQRGEDA